MAMLRTMSTRLDNIETTVTKTSDQIDSVASAVHDVQASRAHMEAWQNQMATEVEAIDRLIADLQAKAKKESPRHTMPKTTDDATMADAASTPAPKTPTGLRTTTLGKQRAAARAGAPHSSRVPPGPRPGTTDTEDDDDMLVFFPTPVVRSHMK